MGGVLDFVECVWMLYSAQISVGEAQEYSRLAEVALHSLLQLDEATRFSPSSVRRYSLLCIPFSAGLHPVQDSTFVRSLVPGLRTL
jgi:hypothetical protein